MLATLDSQGALVTEITFGAQRVPVYNLSIPGSPTYFVGDRGVWVHNCGFADLFRIKFEHFRHRKGWDKILGKQNPSDSEIASVLEEIIATNGDKFATRSNATLQLKSVFNGHDVYITVKPLDNGLYEINTAGLQ